MHLLSRIFIRLICKYVGKDEFGNKYYERKPHMNHFGRNTRFVIYRGAVEASKVPPQWFLWLHHQRSDKPKNKRIYEWQQPYKLNASGTKFADFPPGHINAEGKRGKSTGDYQAWKPIND